MGSCTARSGNRGKRSVTEKMHKGSVGRPRKYTASQAQRLIDKYFQTCSDTKTPCTITGLALALDTSRKVLCEWAERGDELSNTIKKAKDRMENYVEELLLTSKNPAGPIFWLKNFGWTDRQEIVGAGGSPVIDVYDPGREKLTDAKLAELIAMCESHANREQG